jgi:hypothetical protein
MVGGQQSTRSLPHLAELFRLADRAGLLAAARAGRTRMKTLLALHGVTKKSKRCATSRKTTAGCPSTPPPCASSGGWTAAHRSTPARGAASAPSRPGATRWPRWGWRPWRSSCVTPASGHALGLLPRRLLPRRPMPPAAGRAGRQPPRRRRSLHAGRALPGAGGGRRCPARWPASRRTRTSPARAPRCRRHRRHAGVRAQRGHAAGHRAAAPDAGRRARLHQHAGAGAGPVRRAGPRPQRRAGRGGGRCTTCGGTPSCSSRSRAPARAAAGLPRLRLAHAHARPAERPRHDGRRRDRAARMRGWMEAAGYAGFAEVEIFSEHWWQRDGDEVLDTCIARHRFLRSCF